MALKVFTGEIISDKMDKTVVVAVTRLVQHQLYKKTVKKVAKFKAHDEQNAYKIGDRVKIIESKPLSREKRWVVLEKLETGQ